MNIYEIFNKGLITVRETLIEKNVGSQGSYVLVTYITVIERKTNKMAAIKEIIHRLTIIFGLIIFN